MLEEGGVGIIYYFSFSFCPATTLLVLGRHGLAGLELLEVPLAGAHVVAVGFEALCEGLGIGLAGGSGGRDGGVGVHGLLVVLGSGLGSLLGGGGGLGGA